jgi:integrase/recombinase XerD
MRGSLAAAKATATKVQQLKGFDPEVLMARSLPRYLTESQMARLVLAPDPTTQGGLRDRAMLAVLCATGLRASELCNLRVCDVGQALIFVRAGKGGYQRYVPISAKARSAVQAYLEVFPAQSDEPLFRTGPDQPMTRRRLHKIVSQYERALEIPCGLHLLRHSAATRWLNRGVNIKLVQAMLGHRLLSTTAIYLGVATDHMVSEYRRCLEPQGDAPAR